MGRPFRPIELVSLFRDVIEINNVVGNTAKPSAATVIHQVSRIVQPEAAELRAGLDASDRHEIRDGIADVLFTLAGLFGRMGFDIEDLDIALEDCISEPHEGNSTYEHLDKLDACLKALITIAECNLDAEQKYIVSQGIALAAVVWTLRLAELSDVDEVADLRAVVESNWTKFDIAAETAMQTRDKYLAIDVETMYIRTIKNDDESKPLYVTFSSIDQTGSDGKSYPKGKWLKSVNFKDTDFSES